MLSPVRFTALASFIPALLAAQTQAAPSAAVPAPSAVVKQAALSDARRASICDGSEVQSFESRRQLGTALIIGSVAIDAFAFSQALASHGDMAKAKQASALIGVSLLPGLIGAYLHWDSYPNESFWQRMLAGMKTGQTRIEDVRECLRDPSATSSAGSEDKLTYFTSRPLTWETGGTFRAVSLTFRDSVLVEVRRSEVKLPVRSDTSPVPVIVPVP
jgi:hypothetical protein